jgi:hypothetical protein
MPRIYRFDSSQVCNTWGADRRSGEAAVRSGPINENSVVAMTALMEISAVQDQNRPFSRTESFSHQRSEEGFGDQHRSAVIAKA